MRRALAALAALALADPASAADPETTPRAAAELDGDSWFVPGSFPPGRSPDGNSVVLEAPKGPILIDTGRRIDHAASLTTLLVMHGSRSGAPAAIINTHWHLDHVSGNRWFKSVDPDTKVYATSAIDGALAGFLADSAAASRKALAAGTIPAAAIPDVKGDLVTFENGPLLRPDLVVDKSRDLRIAGRPLSLRVAHRAATGRDLWIYDAAAKRAIVGDLVTLPAPFLDTACPEGWLKALDDVAASGARQIVPGHGPLMTMADFAGWRTAFGDFIACARGAGALETCSAGWLAGAASWIGEDKARAKAMVDYYGGLIRSGKLDGYCRA